MKLLILDADVVIWLFENGVWQSFCKQNHVHLAETVVGECIHYLDKTAKMNRTIDWEKEKSQNNVTVIGLGAVELAGAIKQFGGCSPNEIDDGERETICILLLDKVEGLVACLRDTRAIYVATLIGLEAKIVSVEVASKGVVSPKVISFGETEKKFRKTVTEAITERIQQAKL